MAVELSTLQFEEWLLSSAVLFSKIAYMINYFVPMLSLVLPVVLVVAYLYLNPIEVSCVACETGGTFYKCAPGTGAGTKTCDDFNKGQAIVDGVGKEIQKTMDKINKIRDEIMKPIQDTEQAIAKIAADASNLIKPINIPDLKVNIHACKISGTNIDPCSDMNKGMNSALSGLNKALDAVEGAMNKITEGMNGAVDQIIQPLQKKLDAIFQTIVNPWMGVREDINELITDVNQFVDAISALGVGNIIVSYVAGQIKAVFPFMGAAVAVVVATLAVLAWFVGGYFGFFMMMSSVGGSILDLVMLPFTLISSLMA